MTMKDHRVKALHTGIIKFSNSMAPCMANQSELTDHDNDTTNMKVQNYIE